MNTRLPEDPRFNKFYDKHCKHLKLKGLRPKTIEAYARAIRRMGNYFDTPIDRLIFGSTARLLQRSFKITFVECR